MIGKVWTVILALGFCVVLGADIGAGWTGWPTLGAFIFILWSVIAYAMGYEYGEKSK